MIRLNEFDPQNGPLQIVHDFKFTALNVKDDYSALDSMTPEGKLDYIKSRIKRLSDMGYGGVVMNVDYKDYLENDTAFDIFNAAAEYAKGIGMRVWIYDEQYYPSGAAGGLTLVGHPELEALCLACITRDVTADGRASTVRIPSPCGYSELKYAFAAPIINGEAVHTGRLDISGCRDLGGGLCFDAPVGAWRVYAFFLRPLFEQTKFCQGTRASRRFISVFNEKAVERFFDVTFEQGYKAHMGKDKPLSNLAEAVFTDEPYSPFYKKTRVIPTRTALPSESVYDEASTEIKIYPYVPWELTVPERFSEKYGYSVLSILPDIFDENQKTRQARIDFYSLLSEMSRNALPVGMQTRLTAEGVALSGHYYGEEGFDFQPAFYGDLLEHLGVMQIPGCDCLWSDINVLRYSAACKLASSAAHITCKNEVMIEASNMCDRDQNITLPVAKGAISAMFIHGVTQITSYYGENMLPTDGMSEFARYIASLSSLFKGGKYRINTLLYYPFENLCAECGPQGITEGNDNGQDHFGIGETSARLMKHQVTFDFINKKRLLSCRISDGYLITPNGEQVEYIVIPDIPWVDAEASSFLAEAREKGIGILFDTAREGVGNIDYALERLIEGNYPRSAVRLDVYDPFVIVMQRDFGDYSLFMLMNTDTEPHSLTVSIDIEANEVLSAVDPKTMQALPLGSVGRELRSARVPLTLQPLEAVIIARSGN